MNWEVVLQLSFGVIFVSGWLVVLYLMCIEDPRDTYCTKYRQCVICNEKDSDTKSVRSFNVMGNRFNSYDYHYHPSCVREVVCAPEGRDANTMSIAVSIVKSIDESERRNKEAEIRKIQKVLRLKAECQEVCKLVEHKNLLQN